MKKTLYLCGEGVRVRLDGPSLAVRKTGEAERRFPLCRLRRVVCRGGAGLPWDVLMACAEVGLTVASMKADGTPRGIWAPWSRIRTGIGEMVEEWIESGRWEEGWMTWCAGKESREMAVAAWHLRTRLPDLRPAAARRHLLSVCGAAADHDRRRLLDELNGLLYSHVGTRLVQRGLDPLLLVGKQPGFEPARRITEILHWRHMPDVAKADSQVHGGGRRGARTAASVYESLAERESRRIDEFIESWMGWPGGEW